MLSNGFHNFEINCFKNISRFLFVLPLFFILLLSSLFMKLPHIFLGELQDNSFGFQFYLTTFWPCSKVFLDGKFGCILLVAIVVWLCCSSWFVFLIMAYLINVMRQLFYITDLYVLEAIFILKHNFFEKKLEFLGVFYLFPDFLLSFF